MYSQCNHSTGTYGGFAAVEDRNRLSVELISLFLECHSKSIE